MLAPISVSISNFDQLSLVYSTAELPRTDTLATAVYICFCIGPTKPQFEQDSGTMGSGLTGSGEWYAANKLYMRCRMATKFQA